jgi:hypothetical protein
VPVGPGVNPGWLHQTLTLRIGGVEYGFQTLSLFDVWSCWPYLAPIQKAGPLLREAKEAISAGRPLDPLVATGVLEVSAHVVKVLEIIQPALAADEERLKELTPEHFTELLEFYGKQDWSRILALVSKTTAAGAEDSGADPEEAHAIFVGLCAETARFANMDMLTFLKSRFEYAADMIVALRHASEQAREEVDDGRAGSWREATMKLAATFGVKPEAIAEDKKPGWMKALDQVRVN